MDLWFSERHTKDVKLSIKVKKQIFSLESAYQRIDIFDSEEFGRFLTLDGVMMLTERDEFIYHEMITHPAFAVKPDIETVLVIGAGDGGVARELVKYPQVKTVDLVEIDGEVIEACKKYLPQTATGLENPKVNIHINDGLKYIRKCKTAYDLIIVDSTDPLGPGEVLFTREFYYNCVNALTENGILINQHESPFYKGDSDSMQKTFRKLSEVFAKVNVFQAHIPTYPSGHWLFGFSSKTLHPISDLKAEEWNALGIDTKYYNTNLHTGAFCLPTYVVELLKNAKK